MRRLVRFFHSSKESQKEANKETIMPIVMACMSMAKKYVGALIVIERGVPLKDIMDTGEEIDAKINQRLIENIFPGDLEGTQQSGMAFDLKIANIARDGQLVQLARTEAQEIIDNDPECNAPHNALLWNRLKELKKNHINWAAIS